MIIETSTPGADAVREAVERYKKSNPEYAQAIEMYGAIMEVQQEALAALSCPLPLLTEEERDRSLAFGEPLIDVLALELDGTAYRSLVSGICRVVDESKPDGFKLCDELAAWEGLSDERLDSTRAAVLKGEDVGFRPSAEAGENDLEVVRNILWEGLAPFYNVCGSILTNKMEQSSWLRSYCPACGGAPLIGMYREEDGLWLVECSLCHIVWNLQRATCPFCEGAQGSLDFLFVDDDKTRRVNYCRECKRYIKTVDLRDAKDQHLLPLEDIVTMDLDAAARQEGLVPATARFED